MSIKQYFSELINRILNFLSRKPTNASSASQASLVAPQGWGEDNLSRFIDQAEKNIYYPFACLTKSYSIIANVHEVFSRLLSDKQKGSTERELLPRIFCATAHSAYLAACRLALSGQTGDAYAVLRICLENSLYGLDVFHNSSHATLWLKREDNRETKNRCRRQFTIANLLGTLNEVDAFLCPRVKKLYDRLIDFGAHPNMLGILTRISSSKTEELEINYLLDDSHDLRAAYRAGLKITMEIGLCSLKMFEHVFVDVFKRLKLDAEIGNMANKI
jgi:hypothetical protein